MGDEDIFHSGHKSRTNSASRGDNEGGDNIVEFKKNTYIKTLKEAASTIAAGTVELTRRTGPAYGTAAARMTEMRVEVLEKEIKILPKEQAGKVGGVRQENVQCHASTSELGHP